MSYTQRTEKRLAYETQCRERTTLRLQECLKGTDWTRLDEGLVVSDSRIFCKCKCGKEKFVRVADIIAGGSNYCNSCAIRKRVMLVDKATRIALATKASMAAAEALKNKPRPYRDKYGAVNVEIVRKIGNSARQRCNNPNEECFANYGGRGIQFKFSSPLRFAEWVLDNIGVRPTPSHSIDRIDNNRHYEPGNLRWATREEQARNKRLYKRSYAGERIREIMYERKDLTYETIRTWIKQGLTNDEIIDRRKYDRG